MLAPRLVLYSDQISPETDAIDAHLVRMLVGGNGRIGYVPSSPDPDRAWFSSRRDYYDRSGFRLEFYGLEEEFDASQIESLVSCDAIYLTGGNTFRFSYWLRRRGMDDVLRRYVANGGVLIGVSAGAILMTPDIGTSRLCHDEPYPGLSDSAGFGFIDFGFVPHDLATPESDGALLRYCAAHPRLTYAVPDGGGIVVEGSKLWVYGPCRMVVDGQIIDAV